MVRRASAPLLPGNGSKEALPFSGCAVEENGQATGAPVPRLARKDARAGGATVAAMAIVGQVPGRQVIPVAPDKAQPAGMAVGAAALFIMDVAGIGIADAVLPGDLPRPG